MKVTISSTLSWPFTTPKSILSKQEILVATADNFVSVLILFESILNSIASEHGARMTAMHKATDNADELKQGLTLTYNRQRQAAITNEILEIVAGAEALKNS